MLDPNIKVEQYMNTTLPPNSYFGDYKSSNWETTIQDKTRDIDGKTATPNPNDSTGITPYHNVYSILLYPAQKSLICDCVDEKGYQYKRTSDVLDSEAQAELDALIETELNKERARQGKTPRKILGIVTGDISKEDKAQIIKDTTDRYKANAPDTAYEGEYVETGVRRIVKAPITIVDGDKSGEDWHFESMDYRYNPQDAPYRVAIAKLKDGRIVVCCVTYIGRCYGNDMRQGNYFEHTLIFPDGTNIEDVKAIDWKNYPFKKGLTVEEMNDDLLHTPKNQRMLPQLTGREIIASTKPKQKFASGQHSTQSKQSQKQPTTQTKQSTTQAKQPVQSTKPQQPVVMNTSTLLNTLKNAVLNPDIKERRANTVKFAEQIRLGADIFQLYTLLESQLIDAINKGKAGLEEIDNINSMLYFLDGKSIPFRRIVQLAEKYVELSKKIDEANYSGNYEEADRLEREWQQVNTELDSELSKLPPGQAEKFISSYKDYLQAHAKRIATENNSKSDESYMRSNAYAGLKIISFHTKSLSDKKSKTSTSKTINSNTHTR